MGDQLRRYNILTRIIAYTTELILHFSNFLISEKKEEHMFSLPVFVLVGAVAPNMRWRPLEALLQALLKLRVGRGRAGSRVEAEVEPVLLGDAAQHLAHLDLLQEALVLLAGRDGVHQSGRGEKRYEIQGGRQTEIHEM